MATALDLLPEITFAVRDPTAIANTIITGYEAASLADGFPLSLAPGDKRRLFLLYLASLFTIERAIIDQAGKQNLLKYSGGNNLDQLGAFWGPNGARPGPSPALVTLQFILPAALGQAVVVPAGTQASAGTKAIFATVADLTIPAGSTSGTVTAQATQNGSIYNGYVSGQINQLVTWSQAFAVTVVNTTTSQGGADIETDSAYRNLVFLAPLSLAVAGPAGQYQFWAFKFSPAIIDVQVWSKEQVSGLLADGGHVEISILLTGGTFPNSSFLSGLQTYLSGRAIRPLTDIVDCFAPTAVVYNENFTYYIATENGPNAAGIQTAVNLAIAAWETQIATHQGWDINPSALDAAIINAGAKRTTLTSGGTPAFTSIGFGQVGRLGTKTVTYGGLEDE